MIAVLVMTDGRDALLDRTLKSWAEVIDHPLVIERWMHDDTGDRGHLSALAHRYPFRTMAVRGQRQGFPGAMHSAWSQLPRLSAARYVLHLEDDLVLTRPVDLAAMVAVMDRRPHLSQMALRRQAYYPHEKSAGGVVEVSPGEWTDTTDGTDRWLERANFWTCNPSIYRLDLCRTGWPQVPYSEPVFAGILHAADWSVRSGYWGARIDPPYLEHIGHERAGHGY